ncbi:hypothetical protein GPL15_18160 [Clostridium sp. MCC353]|uniref:hypothetical protein n=1 Tax=Clostridium sp. MCC353 TaxID=2592646 RepID=UPI001C01E220|nr:hypothetical protein [Clostridium sp. MCC353]MBT9778425.1 hypothetical protein [Clostridium sp. MCC353]
MKDNERDEMLELLTKLKESSERQEAYAKKQYLASKITAAASVAALILIISVCAFLLPQAKTMFNSINTVMTDMETITNELADANLGQMIDGISQLVSTSEYSIKQAVDRLNAVDIDSLNSSIQSLHDIVGPLSKLFNY